jgi:aspartate/methionine/tyrosine aminotransferase
MIELPPPQKLRERTAKAVLEQEEIHQYRNRLGEEVYRDSIVNLLKNHYKVKDVSRDNVLAISGTIQLYRGVTF